MNKGQLISAVNDIVQDRATSELAVNAVIAVVKEALANGDEVAIAKFGRLKVVTRNARAARNPSTGERIHVPAKQVVKFQMGSELDAAVNPTA
ncbi:HU family DNA-binding protein [Nonomuraea aridisoli]|uniref:DNA-binding protein n=1 Tax=Nonomuraea aridisoli TaxID=2070368 RepID=A0A2W2DIR3_9ACTN|nr:HU family DNA-binding protein [Nonomuraea aridisoli]PZG03839.1 DNA-binding protein [Nonomuraea aridisoli]